MKILILIVATALFAGCASNWGPTLPPPIPVAIDPTPAK